jgi:hypothetical protein
VNFGIFRSGGAYGERGSGQHHGAQLLDEAAHMRIAPAEWDVVTVKPSHGMKLMGIEGQ